MIAGGNSSSSYRKKCKRGTQGTIFCVIMVSSRKGKMIITLFLTKAPCKKRGVLHAMNGKVGSIPTHGLVVYHGKY